MLIFQFVILGLLQGLTEFLPISSSGHLVLFGSIFGFEDSLFVSILLHIATLLSIFVVMRKEILYLIKHPFSIEMKRLFFSTLMTVLIVLLFYNLAKNAYTEKYLPFFFMTTAVLLILSDVFEKKASKSTEISVKQSLLMGLAQGIAVFPGLSRSGTTISVGVLSGMDKEKAAKFSFLQSIPIILASMFMEIIEMSSSKVLINYNLFGLLLGFITAFIVGIFALKIMVKYTEKIKFRYFAIYLIILSIVLLII